MFLTTIFCSFEKFNNELFHRFFDFLLQLRLALMTIYAQHTLNPNVQSHGSWPTARVNANFAEMRRYKMSWIPFFIRPKSLDNEILGICVTTIVWVPIYEIFWEILRLLISLHILDILIFAFFVFVSAVAFYSEQVEVPMLYNSLDKCGRLNIRRRVNKCNNLGWLLSLQKRVPNTILNDNDCNRFIF